MIRADRELLASTLALPLDMVGADGVSIPASPEHRAEYLERAAGTPAVVAAPYWD